MLDYADKAQGLGVLDFIASLIVTYLQGVVQMLFDLFGSARLGDEIYRAKSTRMACVALVVLSGQDKYFDIRRVRQQFGDQVKSRPDGAAGAEDPGLPAPAAVGRANRATV